MKRAGQIILAALGAAIGASPVYAMPWDVDMYRQQSYVTGEIARSPVKGTIPVGFHPWKMSTEDATTKLTNPIHADEKSLQKGKRLWSANCSPCHGQAGTSKGPVSTVMGAPDLSQPVYASKTDGAVYGVIMNGGANMPRYGYKFSDEERWHIINYLRFLQGQAQESAKKADGEKK